MKLSDYEKTNPTWARVWRKLDGIPLDELLVEWALRRIADGTEAYLDDGAGEAVLTAHVEAMEQSAASLERVLPESAEYHRRRLALLQDRACKARIDGAAKAAALAAYVAERME